MTPSFGITVSEEGRYRKGLWVCACGKGNLYEFVKRFCKVEFKEALEIVREKADGITLSKFVPKERDEEPVIPSGMVARIKAKKLLPFAEFGLSAVPHLMMARNYSCIDAQTVCYEFNLGISRGEIGKLQGVRPGWIVVPVFDIDGNYMSYQFTEPCVDGGKSSKYNEPGSKLDVLFNVDRAVNDSWVVVVESIWCVIRMQTWDIPAVATLGAKLSKAQSKTLIKNFKNVFLLYDNDTAGNLASTAAARDLIPDVNVFRSHLPPGKDPDNSSRQEVVEAIKEAERIFF